MKLVHDPFNDGITSSMVQEAYKNGLQAYQLGRILSDNPYPYNGKQWHAWDVGYLSSSGYRRRGPKS